MLQEFADWAFKSPKERFDSANQSLHFECEVRVNYDGGIYTHRHTERVLWTTSKLGIDKNILKAKVWCVLPLVIWSEFRRDNGHPLDSPHPWSHGGEILKDKKLIKKGPKTEKVKEKVKINPQKIKINL